MLSIGRARHPGPGTSSYPPGFSIEFLNVGGWLSRGDLALESSAHFLAIAEHRLIPARARAVTTQLRQARRSSVWAPSCQDVTPGGHAGVGVISLYGAPLSLPTLLDPSFKEFFRIGRAMRVILPLGNGGVVHLFVIYGYQGAESDPEKLQLTDRLFTAVLAEARMCCCGQPVILAGDFNADPIVIPSLAHGISDGQWVDLERAFAHGRGVPPSSTCQFHLDEDKGSRRDFLLACPVALAAASACYVSPDRWFTPHFSVSAEFSLSSWEATVDSGLVRILRFGLLVGFRLLIGHVLLPPRKFVIFGMSTSVRLASSRLRFVRSFRIFAAPLMLTLLGFSGVRKLRLVLLVLMLLLVALPLSGPSGSIGRGYLSMYSMRLGGRCHDRIYHVDRSDEFDVTHFGYFLNSSLAPVLRFRRSFVSVCNVLKGIRKHGFTEARVSALEQRWKCCCPFGSHRSYHLL